MTLRMPSPIAFYFDFISPYAYFGSTQIESLAARYGRSVDWRPVLLGITVIKIMGMKPLPETPLKGPYLHEDAPRMARLFGVPFKHHGLKGINAVVAMRAFLWLKAQDPALARRYADRVFARLWVQGEDITSVEACAEEAIALGVDANTLTAAIKTDAVKESLKTAVDEAVAEGVFGVPFFIVDGQKIWGGDRMWMLEHWLRHQTWDRAARAPSSSSPP